MRRVIVFVGAASLLLAGSRSAGGALAQTSAPAATLYNAAGAPVGSASVTGSGGSMQASVTLQLGQADTAYTVCATDPGDAPGSTCQSSAPGGLGTPGHPHFLPLFNNGSLAGAAYATGTLNTDDNGAGTIALTLPGVIPIVAITVTNVALPADVSQTLVNVVTVGPPAALTSCTAVYTTTGVVTYC